MSDYIYSHSFVHKDFETEWYKRWAKELKQDKDHLDGNALHSNKFWQNAVMVQVLFERGMVSGGKSGVGFGVGQERLPALFAKHGVRITATDQDFRKQKAGHWAEKELAVSAQSLNGLGICDKKTFAENVEYMPTDMTKVPAKLFGKYDFAWSNCALGHLGSIPAGLKFIEQSVECLKPSGWAVHTTELNILSNDKTVEGGSTVLFRLKDIYNLQKKLIGKGYEVSIFSLIFGDQKVDKRISIRPTFGNDFSKIQVMGHLATQIVLLIHKPTKPTSKSMRIQARLRLARSYSLNISALKRYAKTDANIKDILASQSAPLSSIVLEPIKPEIEVQIKQGNVAKVYVEYKNKSAVPLFSLYSRLGNSKPIALATDGPHDRASAFVADDWEGSSRNRTHSGLWVKEGPSNKEIDYIKPGQKFCLLVSLDSSTVKKGEYKEKFAVVQEGMGWVDGSTVTIKVRVA